MQTLERFFTRIEIGKPAAFDNLTWFPLIAPPESRPVAPDYLTLDEAMELNLARVTEVSTGGSVPELLLTTEGNRPVLLLDGEALLGAKQNRVLNLTILAPAPASLKIPVSCVEAGRWDHVSTEFEAASHAQFAKGRAHRIAHVTESLHSSGGRSRSSDQGEVWADIAYKADRMSAQSETSAMSVIYESHRDSVEQYAASFRPKPDQIGAVFALNGQMTGLELFDRPETFGKLLPKLTRSYALDAIEKQLEPSAQASLQSVEWFLKAIAESESERFRAIGLGEDARLHSPDLTGAALVVNEAVIHLSAFIRPLDITERRRSDVRDSTLAASQVSHNSVGELDTFLQRG